MNYKSPEFTFCTLCYNQEDYILEHLESIKYQVTNYGRNYRNHLLIFDDASKDETVKRINKWLERNRELFETASVFSKKNNEGTVKNYIRALRTVKTDLFKILAGDDLYFINNIYKICRPGMVFISPTIKFGCGISTKLTWHYNRLAISNSLKPFIREYLKYKNFIEAPGVFLGPGVINERLIDFISIYRVIEDAPQMAFLANDDDTKIEFSDIPYILYRIESGISTKGKKKLPEVYLNDKVKLCEQVFVITRESFFIRAYFRLKYLIERLIYGYLMKKNNKVMSLRKNMEDNAALAQKHIMRLRGISKTYLDLQYRKD